jgi:hypothetical protein
MQNAIYASRFLDRSPFTNPQRKMSMSKSELKTNIFESVSALTEYGKLLTAVVTTTKLTLERETDGTNASSMTAIQALLDHPFTTGKIRPLLNGMHKVLYKDAEANLKARRKEEDDALKARAPKSLLPRTKDGLRSPKELNQGEEVTDPEGILGKLA